MPEKLSEVVLILVGSTLIILMLTSLIIVSLFINQKRKFRHQKEKAELKNSFEQELLRSHMEIQAQAFDSISRELHDNVGTLISIAMVHMKSLAAENEIKHMERWEEAGGLLNEAMDALRDISRSIKPENITRLGWQKALTAELDRIRKTNLFAVHCSEEGEPFPIELPKQVILFRIVQETLNNIIKHSNGDHIYVHIAFKKPRLIITVRDDGKGFEYVPEQQTAQKSGISNMLARAAMLPARLHIESRPGTGTTMSLDYQEMFTHNQNT